MLWVPHKNCDEAACGYLKFDPVDSSSFIELKDQNFTSTSFRRGVVKGELGQDIVKVGDNGEAFIPRLTFGLATSVNDTAFDKECNGLLGLSPAEYLGTGSEPFIKSAIRQGALKQPLFTVFLHPDPVNYGHPGGAITYGSIDKINCGSIIGYKNIYGGGYQFDINGFSLGEFEYNVKSTAEANFDAMIAAPSDVVVGIAKLVNATYSKAIKAYAIDCDSQFPDLKIKTDSGIYTIKHNNLIIKLNNDKCILAMKPVEKTAISSEFALGIPFMRQYCTIFDIGQQRLGFAEALSVPRTTESTTEATTDGTTVHYSSMVTQTNPDLTTPSHAADDVMLTFTQTLLIALSALKIVINV
ncbi:eukaryotic aspartyl protease [Oesophagostomum dentatum]|uniref:Eukaryotic aspartyl protease n=1 Tax=Oesophagostomum dentatum TaxID=61180 RepID=A0A0B1TCY3_OESDE|nr:eukaryotic aspartyl protease [Oesophagostomum dentatum]